MIVVTAKVTIRPEAEELAILISPLSSCPMLMN